MSADSALQTEIARDVYSPLNPETSPAVDVAKILESQKLSRFVVTLVVASWLVTFFDGFDMNVISFAALYLGNDFGLTTPMLGNLFSLGLLGTMLGGLGSGYLGDKFGRRPTIISLTLMFGLLTLACGLVSSYSQLLVLRFLNGLAIGGVLPVCWTLNVEYSPKRFRTTAITVIMLGYSVGSGLCGPASLWLIPRFGWRAVFLFGGGLSILASLFLLRVLPESVRFLASKGRRSDTVRAIVKNINPSIAVSSSTQFVVADEQMAGRDHDRFRFPLLFKGELAWITPLVWITYFGSALTLYFFVSWGPLVLQLLGVSLAQIAAISPLSSLSGVVFGFVLTRCIDKYGVGSMAYLPLVAAPLLLVIALTHITRIPLLLFIYFLSAASLGITQYGVVSITGIFYPSWFRANGTGWAASIGKTGGVVGPFIGGLLLSSQVGLRNVFCFFAMGPLIVAVCAWQIGRIQRQMSRSNAT